MAAVEEAVVLLVFEGGREVEEIQGAGEAFDGIVEVGRRFGVFADYQVVELAGAVVLEDGADQKGGRASPEIFTGDPLGGGQ
jgi:hypothetical protein